jgi:CRISPR-associated protein Cas2
MLILVTYDVSTKTPAGERRLRKVALVCQDFGQRVQKSVFECSVDQATYEHLMRRLLECIDKDEDSLRFYRLVEPRGRYQKVFGVDHAVDFEAPLIF